ncbi:MAG: sulfite exporter TauE/SafE family protein, partial [Gammaproteobacteria bacterium]
MINQLCTDPIGAGAAFLIGLFGSAHCLVMCGGITAAFSLSIPEKDRQGIRFWTLITSASFGRVISYTLLGILFGLLGGWLRGDHEIFV